MRDDYEELDEIGKAPEGYDSEFPMGLCHLRIRLGGSATRRTGGSRGWSTLRV